MKRSLNETKVYDLPGKRRSCPPPTCVGKGWEQGKRGVTFVLIIENKWSLFLSPRNVGAM